MADTALSIDETLYELHWPGFAAGLEVCEASLELLLKRYLRKQLISQTLA